MNAPSTSPLEDHRPEALAVARIKYPGLSRDDHEDIVQEAMANVLARARKGPIADERSYLLRVVYTVGARVLGDRQRGNLSLDQADGADALEARVDRATAVPTPEEALLATGERDQVRRILATELHPDEAAAVMLRAIDRHSPAEIAQEMGWTPRQYRKLLERGGRKLAAAMTRERDEELLVMHSVGLLDGLEAARAAALAMTWDGERYLAQVRRGERRPRLPERGLVQRMLPSTRTEGAPW